MNHIFPSDGAQLCCKSNEAHSENCGDAYCHLHCLDCPFAVIFGSIELYFRATLLLHCISRMLWSLDGRGWSNEISNLSSRGYSVAAGHCGGQGILEAERG